MKLIFWSNLPKIFFDLILDFLCELRMVRDRAWGIWGELKQWRQIENERFSYSQVF